MIDVLNHIRLGLVYILILLILFGIIFIFLIRSKGKRKRIGIIGIASTFGIAFLILSLNFIITQLSINEVYEKLDYTEKNNLLVLINGRKAEFNTNELFREIKEKDFIMFRNKKHNTTEFEISIIEKKDTFSISLFRDSGNWDKYWIYNNNHDYELEIGSMRSKVLKNLKE